MRNGPGLHEHCHHQTGMCGHITMVHCFSKKVSVITMGPTGPVVDLCRDCADRDAAKLILNIIAIGSIAILLAHESTGLI